MDNNAKYTIHLRITRGNINRNARSETYNTRRDAQDFLVDSFQEDIDRLYGIKDKPDPDSIVIASFDSADSRYKIQELNSGTMISAWLMIS